MKPLSLLSFLACLLLCNIALCAEHQQPNSKCSATISVNPRPDPWTVKGVLYRLWDILNLAL